jgi:hypothetical protein
MTAETRNELKESYERFMASELDSLYNQATILQESYWDIWRKNNEGKEGAERGYTGIFIRMNRGSLEIHWKRYVKTRHNGQRFTKHIKRGKTDGYSNRTLKSACNADWEYELAIKFEERLKRLRTSARKIKENQRSVKELLNALESNDLKNKKV